MYKTATVLVNTQCAQTLLFVYLFLGKGEEQRAAASLACLLCIQLGSGIESEEVFKSLKPIFKTILTDGSANIQARQAVSNSSGLKCYLPILLFFWLISLFFFSAVCNKSGPLHTGSRR